jgi:lysophospholipase L1-like esterase
MRRVLYWYVPALVALIAAAIFATGFYSYLRGDTGTLVASTTEKRPVVKAAAPSATIVPIIVGDSLARGTGDSTGEGIGGRLVIELRKRRIPSRDIINLGINGARTPDLLKQIDHQNVRVLLSQSNAIIVSIGGNDLWGDNMRNAPAQNPEPVMNATMERVERVVAAVREVNPNGRIFVVGLYNPFVNAPFGRLISPLVSRWNARLLERFAGDPNLIVVQTSEIFAYRDRLSEDRFHPNGEGYELIARRIADTF